MIHGREVTPVALRKATKSIRRRCCWLNHRHPTPPFQSSTESRKLWAERFIQTSAPGYALAANGNQRKKISPGWRNAVSNQSCWWWPQLVAPRPPAQVTLGSMLVIGKEPRGEAGAAPVGLCTQRQHAPAPPGSAERKFPKSIWLLSVSAGNVKSTKKLHKAAQINISNFLRPF